MAQEESQMTEHVWNSIETAVRDGKPQTASKLLDAAIPRLRKNKDYPGFVKAVLWKTAFHDEIDPDIHSFAVVEQIEAGLKEAPERSKPLLRLALAMAHASYIEKNQWELLERTAVSGDPGTDVKTWDLAAHVRAALRRFEEALADEKELRAIPIGEFDGPLVAGTAPDGLMPTMFDFIAFNALDFYSSEAANLGSPSTMKPDTNSGAFASQEEFLKWEVPVSEPPELWQIGLQLCQRMIRGNADNPAAQAEADFARIRFLIHFVDTQEIPNGGSRILELLRTFIERRGDLEVMARASALLAERLRQEKDLAGAHRVAVEAAERFPETSGGVDCRNIVAEIERPFLSIDAAAAWSDPPDPISITSKNLSKIHLRAVKVDWRGLFESGEFDLHRLTEETGKRILASSEAAVEWSVDVVPSEEFKPIRVETAPPRPLVPGYYFLFAADSGNFSADAKILVSAGFWVTNLAAICSHDGGQTRVRVVTADRGEPVSGATLAIYEIDRGRNARPRRIEILQSDQLGEINVPKIRHNYYLYLGGYVEHGGQAVALPPRSLQDYSSFEREETEKHAWIFTDRAIYRPGQVVKFKAVFATVNRARGQYKTLAGQKAVLALIAPNGQEVERVSLSANRLGSLSGEFRLPANRGTGRMMLKVVSGPAAQASFRVEEYKRPSFEVVLEAPREGARLGGRAVLPGKAQAFSGAPVGGAALTYRVMRRTILPAWTRWFGERPTKADEEVAAGEGVTGPDGRFEIAFDAKPEATGKPGDAVIFRYEVTVDVTDRAGETRSAMSRIALGWADLAADLSAAEWQEVSRPVELRISTGSLEGKPRAARGMVRIHRLRQPVKIERAPLTGSPYFFDWESSDSSRSDGLSAANQWPLGDAVEELPVETGPDGAATVQIALPAGLYRAVFETTDSVGQKVEAMLPLTVIDPDAGQFDGKLAQIVVKQSETVEPGETFEAVWASGHPTARAFVEVFHFGRRVGAYWTEPGRTQQRLRLPIEEKHRGGVRMRITCVRDSRNHIRDFIINVPWTNKRLALEWERFRSKLEPGTREKWVARVSRSDQMGEAGEGMELLAALYDASLDVFAAQGWRDFSGVLRGEPAGGGIHGIAHGRTSIVERIIARPPEILPKKDWTYRRFDPVIDRLLEFYGRRFAVAYDAAPSIAGQPAPEAVAMSPAPSQARARVSGPGASADQLPVEAEAPAPVDLSQVSARVNLNETAFFLPHIRADKDGRFEIEFEMPEALTRWNFLGLAHDAELRSGLLRDSVTTTKDLMIQPFVPRFLREGDKVGLVVKLTNTTDAPLAGRLRFELRDAATGEPVGGAFGLADGETAFEVAANSTAVRNFPIQVPDETSGAVVYRVVGAAGRQSDGEEGVLPILAKRVLVRESMAMPIRDAGEWSFRFEKLLASEQSKTLRHEKLVLQMVSNPAWYGVLSLPYLMEFPHECSEQVFNRLYANLLARHIATTTPGMAGMLEQWRGTPALESPLEKNPDLHAVAIEETPWLAEARSESDQRKKIARLFDGARVEKEAREAAEKLRKARSESGLWPWFPGGRDNEFISLYIVAGFGRLQAMGVDIKAADPELDLVKQALPALDAWLEERFNYLKRKDSPGENFLDPTVALYLYGRSFFKEEHPMPGGGALKFFIDQARKNWLALGDRQAQAMVALGLNRLNPGDPVAKAIVESIKEHSIIDPEMGRFWRTPGESWWWHRAPIETQAILIELFDEVGGDRKVVEECQTWLLKQRQTNSWPTTKSTADAIYALLRGQGAKRLADQQPVEVLMGGEVVQAGKIEAGTGFFEKRWAAADIRPALGEVVARKTTDGVAWGALHWQYFDDPDKITPPSGGPLKIEKAIFVKAITAKGEELRPVTRQIAVGDEVVIRLVIRADRDMEFVHLKDARASGLEPVDVLSGYRSSGRLWFYQSTRDTATHFFIDHLPRGTHVMEYSARATHRGEQRTGLAEIGCMYAPEFNAHASGEKIVVE